MLSEPLKKQTSNVTRTSGMIHHIRSETSTVKATLEVHYWDLLPCSCHRQAAKAWAWQRKHLNEVVHIFHCSVWKRWRFKFTAQTPLTALQPVKHCTPRGWLLSPWPSATPGPSRPANVSLLFTSCSTDGCSRVSCSLDVWPLLLTSRLWTFLSTAYLPLLFLTENRDDYFYRLMQQNASLCARFHWRAT